MIVSTHNIGTNSLLVHNRVYLAAGWRVCGGCVVVTNGTTHHSVLSSKDTHNTDDIDIISRNENNEECLQST